MNRFCKLPRPVLKASLCVLAFLVFALATYARLSWYQQDCLQKRYLTKAVKLTEGRAKLDVSGDIAAVTGASWQPPVVLHAVGHVIESPVPLVRISDWQGPRSLRAPPAFLS